MVEVKVASKTTVGNPINEMTSSPEKVETQVFLTFNLDFHPYMDKYYKETVSKMKIIGFISVQTIEILN